MKICFVPIDNRPVCYNLALDIASIDKSIELIVPPRGLLGDLTKTAQEEKLLDWLKNISQCDALILSLDTLIYGGLIPSRRSKDSLEVLQQRAQRLKEILAKKNAKIYAFSSIMRISNNNYNEEEKEYWSKYGKKIFDYSYYTHRNGAYFGLESCVEKLIPDDILNDYMQTRRRNFEMNKLYLNWQKEGFFETLIFSKDDCAEYGFNVMEAQELEKLGGKIKTGADEIPLTLLSRAINKDIKVFVEFLEPNYKDAISNYEDVSIEKSVFSQLELGGFKIAKDKESADIVLIINNFIEKQGELVMGWNTKPLSRELVFPNKPYAIADVRFANGADNKLVEQLLTSFDFSLFYGYSAWNTSANTLGSLLAAIKVKFKANQYNEESFKKLQTIRFLDDWAYQANVRNLIDKPCEIKELMLPFEEKIADCLQIKFPLDVSYSFPWNRKFEVEINL